MANFKKLSATIIGTGLALITQTLGSVANAVNIYTNQQNGNKYFLTQPGSWFDAKNQASAFGSLVKIDNVDEQNWLLGKFSGFGGATDAWIGLSDADREGVWRWQDGTIATKYNQTVTYDNWYYLRDDWREPNNFLGIEHYALMGGKDGKWNDFLGAGTYPDGTRPYFPGIGEIDINPSKSRPYEFTSLIFQDNGDWRIPGWDHVALNLSNWIYESTQSPVAQNTTSTKADSELGFGAEVQLEYDNGVQNQRTLNVLQQYHQSKEVEEVPIDIDLGLKMAQAIMTKLDSKYQYITPDPGSWKNISSSRQKGGDNLFTCVGLIEWAAEQAGLNNGQGFLPDDREGFLTPSLLKDAVQNRNRYWGKSGNLWGMIYADPVDFILTDPLGRRLGYTQELGLLNEIPNTFYTGDGWSEQGYVPDLLQGQYRLDLFGLDDHAAVAFGNADNGVSFDGYLAKGEKRTLVYTVPEPSSVIGILSVSIVGAASLLKKRRKTQTI